MRTQPVAEKTRISRRLVAKIASQLTSLVEGQSKPVKLPSERELAEKFDISRRGIRLAIRILENKNLVVRKHGSGNYLIPSRFSVEATYLIIPAELKVDDPFYSSLISQLTLYGREHQIQLVPIRCNLPPQLRSRENLFAGGRIKMAPPRR